jgi:hypothetical protein
MVQLFTSSGLIAMQWHNPATYLHTVLFDITNPCVMPIRRGFNLFLSRPIAVDRESFAFCQWYGLNIA